MSLNIKNEETYRLVHELAALTGESLTAATTVAVKERLERVRREAGTGLAERLLAIGQDCARHLKEPYRSAEHGDLLYDELTDDLLYDPAIGRSTMMGYPCVRRAGRFLTNSSGNAPPAQPSR